MAKSCLNKPENVAKRRPGSTLEAPKNRLKTDPEIHLGPRGPITWPKVARSSHFTAQTSHFIDFGYHFASFLKGICDPKAAKQESGKAANLSSILNISSRVGGSLRTSRTLYYYINILLFSTIILLYYYIIILLY